MVYKEKKMRRIGVLLLISILCISCISAGFFPKPKDSSGQLQPNTVFAYNLSLSTSSDCSTSLLSNSTSITTGNDGIGFIDLLIEGLTDVPTRFCEYRSGVLNASFDFPDSVYNRIYAVNVSVSERLGIGTTFPSSELEVNGTIALSSDSAKTLTTAGTELILSQTGDATGGSSLTFRNRDGLNGALFTTTGIDLVDFGFVGSGAVQQNIRYEHRSTKVYDGNTAQFEIGFPDNESFFTGTGVSGFPYGNVGIGTTTPSASLDINLSSSDLEMNVSSALYVDDGSVGIGTSSPSYDLDIMADSGIMQRWGVSGQATDAFLAVNNNANIVFGSLTNHTLDFKVNNMDLMTLSNEMKVGIGNTNPPYKLHINDTANQIGMTDDSSGQTWILDADDARFQVEDATGLTLPLRIEATTPTNSLYLDSTGNVGIGEGSPQQELHITATDPFMRLEGGSGSDAGIELTDGSTRWIIFSDASNSNAFQITESTSLPILTIENQEVGIGVTTPERILHISGNNSAGTFRIEGDANNDTVASDVLTEYFLEGAEVGQIGFDNGDLNKFMIGMGDTGFSSPSFVIDQDGKVGIGTSSPDELLHIEDSSAGSTPRIVLENDAAKFYFQVNGVDSDKFQLIAGDFDNLITIDSSDDMGIGTNNPDTKLQVETTASGDILKLRTTADGGQQLEIGIDTTNKYIYFDPSNSAPTYDITFFADSAIPMLSLDQSTGNVGIGTATPSDKLHVQDGDLYVNGSGSSASIISVGSADGQHAMAKFFEGDIERWAIYSDQTTDDLYFREDGSGSSMVLEEGGDVGIGTTSPQEKLHVWGSVTDVGFLVETTAVANAKIRIKTPVTRSGEINFEDGTQSGRILYFHGADWMTFVTNGSEHMKIDALGRIGIGTSSPTYPLEVIGNESTISIWADGNVSATGFITRTSIFDKSQSTKDYIKDADYYLDKGEIDHSKFYGYAGTFTVTDYSRPETEEVSNQVCEDVIVGNLTTQECSNVTTQRTIYPYTKEEEGVDLGKEIDLLRQTVFEMSEDLCTLGISRWC